VAKRIGQGEPSIRLWKVTDPDITIPLSHCVSSYLPLSEPAQAVRDILLELVSIMHTTQPEWVTAKAPKKPRRASEKVREDG
jgi:hypothetical protein